MYSCLEKETDFPIFSACEYKNLVFLSGGGGGKKFGVKNQLETRNRMGFKSLNTQIFKETLIEGLYALENLDCLIAYSDTKIFFYEILPDSKILLKKEMEFKISDFSDFIKVYAFDKYLIIYDNNKFFRIYEIQKNKDLVEIFSIEINKTIMGFYAIPNIKTKEIFVIFKKEILIFSLKEKKFINNILKNYNFLRTTFFIQISKDNFLLIGTNRDKTELVFIKKDQKNNFQIKKIKNILNCQISTFSLKKSILAISTIEGLIKIYEIKNNEENLLINSKLHNLPVKSILLREMPYPKKKDDKNITVSTFGLDYKIKTFEFSPEHIHERNRFKMMKFMVVFILLFAFLMGYFFVN